MNLELTNDQAAELKTLLETWLADTEYELAASDNPRYRAMILLRRHRITEVYARLAPMIIEEPSTVSMPAPAIYEELSRRGD